MDVRLKSKLIDSIDEWAKNNCESDEWPDAYWYDGIETDMANAAEAVFDANFKGQKFAEENK